jgi:hypothetical protein
VDLAAKRRRDHYDNVEPATGPEAFDVFELDQHDQAGGAADEVRSGSRRAHPRLDRVRAHLRGMSRTDQWLAVTIGIALAVAVLAGTEARQSDRPIRHIVKTKAIAAPTVAVDALGCPVGRACVTVQSPGLVLAAGHDALPSARVTYAMTERDRTSGAVYRIVLDLSAAHTTIHIVSVCVPGGAPVATKPIAVTLNRTGTTVSKALPTPAGRKQWTITLANWQPDDASCGTTVIAESTLTQGIDGQGIDTVIDLLANDPSLMASM